MGFFQFPTIANIFMVWFEELAIEHQTKKSKLWLRYLKHTLIIWEYGQSDLLNFLYHVNKLKPNGEGKLWIFAIFECENIKNEQRTIENLHPLDTI